MVYSKENPETFEHKPATEAGPDVAGEEPPESLTPEEKIAQIKAGFLPYDVFDPELEVAKISKLSKEEKREALEKFKEEYAEQRVGILRLHREVEEAIKKTPDISREELEAVIASRAEELRLSLKHFNLIEGALDRYQNTHAYVKNLREQYPDDTDLFVALCGSEPHGKIKVMESPVTLHFICEDKRDYIEIWKLGQENPKDEYKDAGEIGMHIKSGITIEKGGGVIKLFGSLVEESSAPEGRTQKHEEHHGVLDVISPFKKETVIYFDEDQLKATNDPKERQIILDRCFRNTINYLLQDTREEMPSYFLLEGPDVFFTTNNIAKMKDYYAKDAGEEMRGMEDALSAGISEKDHKNIEKLVKKSKKHAIADFRQKIGDGFNSIIDLHDQGFSEEEIFRLLGVERLQNWPKVVGRILENRN